mmetsp:Transcript_98031/g.272784  ORF Transcript_98031/g.272784 Transcript_98031/m.272784 type:complete len:217 (-) Transcript_98031:64-714(-)
MGDLIFVLCFALALLPLVVVPLREDGTFDHELVAEAELYGGLLARREGHAVQGAAGLGDAAAAQRQQALRSAARHTRPPWPRRLAGAWRLVRSRLRAQLQRGHLAGEQRRALPAVEAAVVLQGAADAAALVLSREQPLHAPPPRREDGEVACRGLPQRRHEASGGLARAAELRGHLVQTVCDDLLDLPEEAAVVLLQHRSELLHDCPHDGLRLRAR